VTARPTGGGIPLRPLSLGELLNGAVTSMRRSPAASLGFAAVLSVIPGLVAAIATLNIDRLRSTGHVPSAAATISVNVTNLVVGFILNALLYGILAPIVGRNLQGMTTSLREAWQLARPRLPALAGTTGLLLLIYCALWIPFLLLLAAAAGTRQPVAIVLTVLVGLATVIAEVAGWALLSLAAVAVVLERTRPVMAIRRSWQLVRASFWRVLGILLVTALVYFVAAEVLALPFVVAQTAMAGLAAPGVSALPIGIVAVGAILAGGVTRPFLAGVTVLVYCDIRMRREGLDLVLRASAGQHAGDAGLLWAPPVADSADHGQSGQPAW
jgi:hypothetical protein